jgi:hypothetical protein
MSINNIPHEEKEILYGVIHQKKMAEKNRKIVKQYLEIPFYF